MEIREKIKTHSKWQLNTINRARGEYSDVINLLKKINAFAKDDDDLNNIEELKNKLKSLADTIHTLLDCFVAREDDHVEELENEKKLLLFVKEKIGKDND